MIDYIIGYLGSDGGYILKNLKRDFNITVSKSTGILDFPKLKAVKSLELPDIHGEVVDVSRRLYEPRDITLDCFITADNKGEFIANVNRFYDLMRSLKMFRLEISPGYNEYGVKFPSLFYEVYLKEGISVNKKWSDGKMVGEFSLKLREPAPLKSVWVFKLTDIFKNTNVFIEVPDYSNFTIYWGDGTSENADVYRSATIRHSYESYSVNGIAASNYDFYVVITGDIDMATKLWVTYGSFVWERI